MKNLKDKIEEIDSQVAKLEGVYLYETGKVTGAGSEGWYVKRDEVVALVTSLIEQEKERAGREILDKFASWVILNKHDLEIAHDLVEYLAERKE